MIAWAVTIRPPPPNPCTARKPISSTILRLRPDSADPIRKIAIAASNMCLRPYRSPSLPHIGVETVDASRYAVTTHESWSTPPRSPTIVGRAVATTVWSRDASSIPSISAPKIRRTCSEDEGRASMSASPPRARRKLHEGPAYPCARERMNADASPGCQPGRVWARIALLSSGENPPRGGASRVRNPQGGRLGDAAHPRLLGHRPRNRAGTFLDAAQQHGAAAGTRRTGPQLGALAAAQSLAYPGTARELALGRTAGRRAGRAPPLACGNQGAHRGYRASCDTRSGAVLEYPGHHCLDRTAARPARDRVRLDPDVPRGDGVRRGRPDENGRRHRRGAGVHRRGPGGRDPGVRAALPFPVTRAGLRGGDGKAGDRAAG